VREALGAALKTKLSGYGFKTRGNNWHRSHGDVHAVINLQKSQLVAGCYINIGISLLSLNGDAWLAESNCPVRFRIEEFGSLREKARLLDAEAEVELGTAVWLDAVREELIEPLVASLVKMEDVADLKALLRGCVSKQVFLHRDIRALLESVG
jgi:hypothetical protein